VTLASPPIHFTFAATPPYRAISVRKFLYFMKLKSTIFTFSTKKIIFPSRAGRIRSNIESSSVGEIYKTPIRNAFLPMKLQRIILRL